MKKKSENNNNYGFYSICCKYFLLFVWVRIRSAPMKWLENRSLKNTHKNRENKTLTMNNEKKKVTNSCFHCIQRDLTLAFSPDPLHSGQRFHCVKSLNAMNRRGLYGQIRKIGYEDLFCKSFLRWARRWINSIKSGYDTYSSHCERMEFLFDETKIRGYEGL